jgi:hypothetical protein
MDVLALYVLASAFFLDERGLGLVNVTGTGPSPRSVAMVTGWEIRGIRERLFSLLEPAGRNTEDSNGRRSTVY